MATMVRVTIHGTITTFDLEKVVCWRYDTRQRLTIWIGDCSEVVELSSGEVIRSTCGWLPTHKRSKR